LSHYSVISSDLIPSPVKIGGDGIFALLLEALFDSGSSGISNDLSDCSDSVSDSDSESSFSDISDCSVFSGCFPLSVLYCI